MWFITNLNVLALDEKNDCNGRKSEEETKENVARCHWDCSTIPVFNSSPAVK